MKPFIRNLIIIVIVSSLSYFTVQAVDDWRHREQDPCPEGMAFIASAQGGFCLDRYEASAGSDCPVASPQSIAETRRNLDDDRCRPIAKAQRQPWRFISRDQAERACAAAGKRLPTAAEWQAGALGTDAGSRENPLCHLYNNWPEQPGLTGSSRACVSDSGHYDMAGNVWEWVADVVKEGNWQGRSLPESGYISASNGQGLPGATRAEAHPDYGSDYFWIKEPDLRAVAKGGYYDSEDRGGIYSTYAEISTNEVSPGIGFRCAK